MDKAILKKFAIESRELLMSTIANKIKSYKVDEEFEKFQNGDLILLKNSKTSLKPLGIEEYNKREKLVSRIRSLSDSGDFETGKKRVIEESAYTWFNRIIAIRYMEINDMLPLTKDNRSLGIRVLSSRDNTPHPEILKINNLTNKALNLDIKIEEYTKLTSENEQFKYVLKKVCNKLGKIIPQIFDGNTDYIDILLPENLLSDNGFVTKVISEIPEDNFNEVENKGWLYQYYNQTEKDKAMSKKKSKYSKDEIAYVTQLFTPDWIVKYMVENSLGRLWIEHNGDENLINNWKYFIKDNIKKQSKELDPEKIKFIDPCCGSGHILVYAFEILYQIYLSKKIYIKENIPELILKNNLYGLDIDDRAGQLSILSVILKAKEYDENIFNKINFKELNIMAIQESNNFDYKTLNIFKEDEEVYDTAKYVYDLFQNAKEIGSLLIVEKKNYQKVLDKINQLNKEQLNLEELAQMNEINNKFINYLKCALILSTNYDAVVTNPPYMNSSLMSTKLKEYTNKNYTDFKSDLFSSFIIKNISITKDEGYLGYMTPYVWMFIATYEKLRNFIINNVSINSLIQFEYSAFEEATVPICSFTINKSKGKAGKYYRLTEHKGGMEKQKEAFLEANKSNKDCYYRNISKFSIVPSNEIVYWLSDNAIENFKYNDINKYINPRIGLVTGDTNRFLRLWYELNNRKINFHCKNNQESIISKDRWFPYQKGGNYRKWFGNNEYVVNWENDGYEMRNNNTEEKTGRIRSHNYNGEFGFKKAITWTKISSSNYAFRYVDDGYLFDDAGPIGACVKEYEYLLLALYNSKVGTFYLSTLNPTLNLTPGNLLTMPFKTELIQKKELIDNKVKDLIKLYKEDWDSYENSWNYKRHPLIEHRTENEYNDNTTKRNYKIKDIFDSWKNNCEKRFNLSKQIEEELNKILIDIYGLQKELIPEIEDKDVTIRRADREREIKSLISYAIGCMFGRYSLDEYGVVNSGDELDDNKYKSYEVDKDNVIPITEEAYFNDDIVNRFKRFIETAYGKEFLNENMNYIAETLGKKNNETDEETLRRYFLNDFYKEHIQTYQKKPIYWLFDSGKKNGFKCLIYMHRYNENLVAKIRLDYLYKLQRMFESRLDEIKSELKTGSLSIYDVKKLEKEQENIQVKLDEIKTYNDKLSTIGDKKIKIDLDDGVTENYKKFIYVDPITNKKSNILGEENLIIPKKR